MSQKHSGFVQGLKDLFSGPKVDVSKDEQRKLIMQSRFQKSPKNIKDRYHDNEADLIRRKQEEQRDRNRIKISERPYTPIVPSTVTSKKTAILQTNNPRTVALDVLNSERNIGIILAISRYVADTVVNLSNTDLNEESLVRLRSFIGLIISEGLSFVYKDKNDTIKKVQTFISVANMVYKVIVYLNANREIEFDKNITLADESDLDNFSDFKKQHTKTISNYYGDIERMGGIVINASKQNDPQKKHSIVDEYKNTQQAKIKQLEDLVGTEMPDHQICLQSITCSGFAKEYNDVATKKINDQDGLATLGDAVLKAIISESLFRNDPSISSGSLTDEKRNLENNPELQAIGKTMKIESILFSRNNELDGNKKIATAIEAIIGAVYLSNGIQEAKNFVNKYILRQG